MSELFGFENLLVMELDRINLIFIVHKCLIDLVTKSF